MSSPSTPSALEGIAVIGMSGRFPRAKDTAQFWENLVNGIDGVTRFSENEMEYSVATPAALASGQKFVRARATLENVDLFDAGFFGILPREAEQMDPQHRLFLECAWEALENAAHDPSAYPGMIGVYAGLSLNTYLLYNLCADRRYIANFAGNFQVGEYQAMIGNDKDFLPTRVAYRLNLRGPAMAVQCACSTSLVAISQACSSLLSYQTDMALAGGVSISFPQKRDYLYTEDAMVSGDGTCRTFDAGANGTLFGHGVGVVLLKRLEDAVADHDNILAVIKGHALNNDGGEKIGYAAPSVKGQADVIALAQAAAGIKPESISYIEAHGTGTPLGDPIEIAALTQAFRNGGATRNGYCAVGSGKTHIGHLDAAAGVTGLIKTVLQLQHEQIPALLHYKSPNPKIDFANSPFYPVAKLTEWKRGATPRRAGVSAFGVGGTNAHLIVEEAPTLPATGSSRPQQLLLLSAKSETALQHMSDNLAACLEKTPEVPLADTAFTLALGRRGFPFRRAVCASDSAEAVRKLRAGDVKSVIPGKAAQRAQSVVFLFPGQGAQYVDMGRELYDQEPAFREGVDRCADLLRAPLGLDLRHVIYPNASQRAEAERQINETCVTQPSIFVVEYALSQLWISWGIKPALVIGHSIGEYVAAVLAGSCTLEDALTLLALRAKLMQSLPPGSMLAVRLGANELAPLLPAGAAIAALNSPSLTTVSGPTDILQAFHKVLESKKIAGRLLPTSHAFHSAMMDPIVAPFTEGVRKIKFTAPQLPWISTCTGTAMTAEALADPGYWARQLRHTVRFADAIATVVADPQYILLEVGPGQALTTFARQHPAKHAEAILLSSLAATPEAGRDLSSLLAALGRIWTTGVAPDWQKYFQREHRRRVALPTYPFERKRFWIEPVAASIPLQTGPSDPLPSPVIFATLDTAQFPSSFPPPEPLSANPPLMASSPVPASGQRRDSLLTQLHNLIKELSGIEITDEATSFMEFGLDSLFLTQASQAIQSKFGVKITFRQLASDLSSSSAVAAYLDAHMPAAAPVVAPAATATTIPAASAISGGSVIEQMLAQQAQLLQLVIAQQHGGATPVPAATASSTAGSPGLSVVKWPGANAPASVIATTQQEFKRFGPYKPVERGEKGGLTPRQQQALDDLIVRYLRKTPGSKKYTAEHRAHYADPRAVAGFKQNWKEIVYPIVSVRSKGSKIWDMDDNEYIDITMGFGTYFFGHSPDFVIKAVEEQLHKGIEIGPQNPLAGKIAKLLTEFTGMDRVTFCNTGSEAVMAAIRLARTITGRKRIVYFNGDYHGMFEEVLARPAWVNGEYRVNPIAPGIPQSLVENVLVLEYGAPESLQILRQHAHEIAAVMVEPVQGRNPGLQPKEFLLEVRAITEKAGTPLIFDEVVTGFRCHPGGAQAYFGIKADLATYGKVIGGGIPIGVLAGQAKFMDALDGGNWNFGDDSYPEVGMTFFAGTFVRHPLAMASAWAVLNHIKENGARLQLLLTERMNRLCRTLNADFERAQVPIRIANFGGLSHLEYAHDLKYISLLWYLLREKGIHSWEGRPCHLTLAHSDEDCDKIIAAFRESIAEMQAAGFLPEGPAPSGERLALYPRLENSPLTEAQREIFFSVQMGDEANCAYNEGCYVDFHGTLHPAALQRGLLDVVQRHSALRSTFSADGEHQIFQPVPSSLDLPLEDLSALAPAERDTRFAALLAAEPRTAFDLVRGPLLRLRLVKLAPDHHTLLYTVHHLVCDGWSLGMVIAELCASYNAAVADKPILLPPPMGFGDYARLMAKQKDGAEAKAAEEYWLKQFANGAPALELPTDRARPAVKSYAGSLESRVISPERFARLKKATPQLGGTPFSTLLAAFAGLLHRLTGQKDLVIGVPAAGQTMVGCNELVGHCLNFLPLRVQFSDDTPFAQFAKSIKQSVLDAYDQQNVTYGTLVQKLKLPRDTSRLPLVSVMFNIDKAGLDLLSFQDLKFELITNPKQFVNFELFFNLVQTETTLEVECEFNTDLFDRATIARWLEAYEMIIEAIITGSQTKLAALPVLGETERRLVLEEWNQTKREYPRNQTLRGLFSAQATATPKAIAVTSGDKSLTYAELAQASSRLASHLRQLGVKTGDLIGLCTERSLDMVVGIYGILKSGGAYVPMDPAFPAERLGYMVEDAKMPVIITQTSLASTLPPHQAKLVILDGPLPPSPTNLPPVIISAEDLAYVIFTSGSTGRPKGVQISHRAVVNFLNSMRREPGLMATDILFSVTTLSFDIAGLELHLPLTTGAKVIIAPRAILTDGNLLLRELELSGATVMQATPATWRLLLLAGWKGSKKLKILIGGEAVPRELVNQLAPLCAELWNMYGPTETTIWSTVGRLTTGEGVVSIGHPIDNTDVYILDAQLQPVPIGLTGELFIGGDGLARGYLSRPELTADKFIAHPFKPGQKIYNTGDLARWHADGTIECLGRSDSQVKIRGFRIELGEIEAQLAKHPDLRQNVVVAREDSPGQKRLVAYVVAGTTHAPDAATLQAHLATKLPDYMVPTAFVTLAKLPLTPNGKIDRKALPAPDGTVSVQARAIVPARTPLEQTLIDIWKKVLHREQLGIEDDIFELGGDSLSIFQITTHATQAGLALSPTQMFRLRTIARLSTELAAAAPVAGPTSIARVDRSGFARKR